MKTNSTFRTFALVALLLSILNPQLSPCRAQGTAFTYQGRLNDAVAPANGIYDLTFALFNAGSGSGQVGGTQTNTALAVSNGLFTVTLDFGANFPGADRWLEMRVRTNGSGTFTTLAPRQKLTATPYAITAGDVTGANVARLNLSNTTVQATGHPIVTSGFITGAIVDSGGSGYTTAPSVIVNDSTGSGAIISATVSNGAVVSLTVNNAGSSYSPAATLTIGLPPNNAKQTFSGTNLFSGVNTLTNQNNVFAGDGSGLTGLWRLSGNAGTTPGTHFLGTTDNQPLEVRVNNRRALRIEPTTNSPNVIGGFSNNVVSGGATGATIGGGGSFGNANQVTANFGTIGGGRLNLVSGDISTVAGGYQNRIESAFASAIVGGENNRIVGPGAIINDGSFIGGGDDNLIWGPRVSSTISLGGASTIVGGNMNTIETNADFSFIGGGTANTIGTNSDFSTIGGGNQNVIAPNSFAATIPGGDSNAATNNAFAAGRRAKANHTGAFVWADSQNSDFASTDTNQFLIRASGGVGIGTTAPESDLHVFRGSAGAVTANATAPLVVESDANAYINILSPSDTTSGILFGSPLSSIDASIRYNNSGSGRELTLRTLNSQRMIITTNGDVGIGANIPDARLHVFDGSAGVVTANGNSVAVFERSGNGYLSLLTPAANESGILFGNPNSNTDGGIIFNSGGSAGLQFRTGTNSTKMTITDDGNVGIGTTVPDFPLVIRGVSASSDWLTFRTTGDVNKWQLNGFSNGLNFAQSSVADARLFLASNGNVGIGTLNPTNRLHVIGGVSATAFVNTSDRNAKENFAPVSPQDVLNKVAALPITTWNFKTMNDGRHMGPMAQDFYATFGLGGGDTTITSVDPDGVALAAIQGLNQKLDETRAENADLRQRLERLERLLEKKTSAAQ